MNILFKNIGRCSTICVMLLLSLQLNAQNFTLKGRVVDAASRQPLSDASIVLPGGAAKTVTNTQGYFTLQLTAAKGSIIVSYIGYRAKQVNYQLPKDSSLLIFLEAADTALQGVTVSTGYQKLPKERSTGSFVQLNESLLNQQFSTGILSRLESIANGLSVGRKTTGGSGQLLIRGLSTINGPKTPLIVVDNFPYEGDINNINPNEIESVTLLKDAAAASIWGTRAGNGVIVITTKKASLNKPLKVNFSMGVRIAEKPDLFYRPVMSSGEVIETEQFLFSRGYRFADTASPTRPPFTPVYELLFRHRRGQISTEQLNTQLNAWKQQDLRNDFDRYMYQNALARQYALQLSAGSNQMAWLLSAGIDDNSNELAATYKRANFKLENTYQPIKGLRMQTSLNYTHANSKTGKIGYTDLTTIRGGVAPYISLVNADGTAAAVDKDYRRSYIDTAGAGKLLDWNYYPLTDYQHNWQTSTTEDILVNLQLNYQLLPSLNAEIKYQYEQQTGNSLLVREQESYFTRDYINRFTQINRANGTVINKVPLGGIANIGTSTLKVNRLRYQLNFQQQWGHHVVNALLGGDIANITDERNSYRVYGYDNDLLTVARVDFATTQPTFITGSNSFIEQAVDFSSILNRTVSLFSNAGYSYKETYLLNLSVRRDASNNFGINTNNRWTPLSSVGIGWNVHKEKFYHSKWIPYLKLRATYGVSGNIDPSLTAITTIAYSTINPFTGTTSARPDRFANPELRWEKSKQLNIGIDFKTAKGIVTGSVEWYSKRGIDLYAPALVDYTVGLAVPTITKNVASMKSNGIDIDFTARLIQQKNFQWQMQGNINTNTDAVTDYFLQNTNGSSFVGDGVGIAGIIGKPVYSIFRYAWGGLDPANGNPRGILNKQLSTDYSAIMGSGTKVEDLVFFGSVSPRWFGSMGQSFKYKGFALDIRLMYKLGYYFTRSSINYSSLFGGATGHADFTNRWKQPGDEAFTDVPSMLYPLVNARETFYNASEVLVEKGDHIRLQYITLSYNIDKKQWKALPLSNLQLYINANDLGIVWRANKKGLDPDYFSFSFPPARNIAVGLRCNF